MKKLWIFFTASLSLCLLCAFLYQAEGTAGTAKEVGFVTESQTKMLSTGETGGNRLFFSVFQVGRKLMSLPQTLDTLVDSLFSRLQWQEETEPEQDADSMEYRAMWISYLEMMSRDLSTREKFVAEFRTMFTECKEIGLNRVIVQVRPYGDALYPSAVYPWSHLLTGTQGKDPGFDPLAEMIVLAKELDLKIEAWINPYRARIDADRPSAFSWDNPAHNSDLTLQVGAGIYYNPALPQVQEMVVAGVRELVENYDLDGIHLDDYFYPSTDLSLDLADYLASGTSLSQEDWRRENVNTLVKALYDCIKSINPQVEFGISPQGNNSNNYHSQYSDVNLWLSTAGYVDYITPQLYWGYEYVTSSGSTEFQFASISQQWNNYPRHEEVKLYVGLAAYRIGTGDGSAYTLEEWNSGENLARMIRTLQETQGISGYTLFRHDFLFQQSGYPQLAQSEREQILAAHLS